MAQCLRALAASAEDMGSVPTKRPQLPVTPDDALLVASEGTKHLDTVDTILLNIQLKINTF